MTSTTPSMQFTGTATRSAIAVTSLYGNHNIAATNELTITEDAGNKVQVLNFQSQSAGEDVPTLSVSADYDQGSQQRDILFRVWTTDVPIGSYIALSSTDGKIDIDKTEVQVYSQSTISTLLPIKADFTTMLTAKLWLADDGDFTRKSALNLSTYYLTEDKKKPADKVTCDLESLGVKGSGSAVLIATVEALLPSN